MRILLVTGEHPEIVGTNGGIGTFVALAADALARAGHEVHQLVCAAGLPVTDRAASPDRPAALHARPVLAPLRVARGQGPRLAAIAGSCRWHADRLGHFDIVEAPEFHGIGAFLPHRRTLIQLQTPAAVIAREDPRVAPPTRSATWLEQRAVRRAGDVVSISQLLVSELRGMGWLEADRPVDLSPAIADLHLPPLPPADGSAGVLGVGRVEPRKGFGLLVDAVAELGRPQVRLEIAGADTPDATGVRPSDQLRRHAERRGVDLVLLGQLERADLRAALQRSGVVGVPSTFDSFNLGALEALAAGRPVVVSRRVGLAEHDDGSGAIRVVDRTAVAFAGALAAGLDADAATMAVAARAVAERLGPAPFAADRVARYAAMASS